MTFEGDASEITNLQELAVANRELAADSGQINWFLDVSIRGDVLYFVVLQPGKANDFVCQLQLKTKQISVLNFPFPSGIAVDVESGVVYGRHLAYGPQPEHFGHPFHVIAKAVGGKPDKKFAVSREFWNFELSPNRKRLLISGGDLEKPLSSIAVLDIDSGKETILPLDGSNAVWGSEDSIFFLRGETSLWSYNFQNESPKRVMFVPGERTSEDSSFAKKPILSNDKSWLCWSWAIKYRDGAKLGTVLIDLKNREFRTLDDWWHNVQWGT